MTGDTLCDQKKQIVLEDIVFPETVISMAVEPESSAEKDKLESMLTRLSLQDPPSPRKSMRTPGRRSSLEWENFIWRSSRTGWSGNSI